MPRRPAPHGGEQPGASKTRIHHRDIVVNHSSICWNCGAFGVSLAANRIMSSTDPDGSRRAAMRPDGLPRTNPPLNRRATEMDEMKAFLLTLALGAGFGASFAMQAQAQ